MLRCGWLRLSLVVALALACRLISIQYQFLNGIELADMILTDLTSRNGCCGDGSVPSVVDSFLNAQIPLLACKAKCMAEPSCIAFSFRASDSNKGFCKTFSKCIVPLKEECRDTMIGWWPLFEATPHSLTRTYWVGWEQLNNILDCKEEQRVANPFFGGSGFDLVSCWSACLQTSCQIVEFDIELGWCSTYEDVCSAPTYPRNSTKLYRNGRTKIEQSRWSEALPSSMWTDDQCSNIGIVNFASLELCKERCLSTESCTAFNFASNGKSCVLRNCFFPIVTPKFSHDHAGYHIVLQTDSSGLAKVYSFGKEAKWSSALSRHWSDEQCPRIADHKKDNPEQCMATCANSLACTAINFNISSKICSLWQCPYPLPYPLKSEGDMQGYHLLIFFSRFQEVEAITDIRYSASDGLASISSGVRGIIVQLRPVLFVHWRGFGPAEVYPNQIVAVGSSSSYDQKSLTAPTAPRLQSATGSVGARDWLLMNLGVQLKLDWPRESRNLQVGLPTYVNVVGLDAAGRQIQACPEVVKKLTFWSAAVSVNHLEGKRSETVEAALIKPNPGSCIWQVEFTPSTTGAYDLHVRTTWWNDGAQPAYSATVQNAGTCLQGESLQMRVGWINERKNVFYFDVPTLHQCMDFCTADERCNAWNMIFEHENPRKHRNECRLFGNATSYEEVVGNCTSGPAMHDRGAFRYLGGWSLLQATSRHSIKDNGLHSLSHVIGSPMALGFASGGNDEKRHSATCSTKAFHPGRVVLHEDNADILVSWEPRSCQIRKHSIRNISACFQRRDIRHIVFGGDSLIREQYFSMQQLYRDWIDLDYNNMDSTFVWPRPDGVEVSIRLESWSSWWSNENRGFEKAGLFKEGNAIFITNLDAHWLVWYYSDEEISQIVHKFAGLANKLGSRVQKLVVSSVYVHSWRQRYIQPARLEAINRIFEEVLLPSGFEMLDIYNMTRLLGNVSNDGMHLVHRLVAPADTPTRMITPFLLEMMCR